MPRKKYKYSEYLTLGYDADGKRVRKYIGSDLKWEFEQMKKDAIIEFEKIRNPSYMNFGEYAEKWFEIYKSNKSIQTQSAYRNALNKFGMINGRKPKEITQSQLQEIINENWEHPRVCQYIRLTLKQIYDQAIKDGIVQPINIAKDLTLPKYKPKEKRFFTDKEIAKIREGAYTDCDRLFLEVLIQTGMRPGEALALKWEDIKPAHIHVSRSLGFDVNTPYIKETKTDKERDIPITKKFSDMMAQKPHRSFFIFTLDGRNLVTKSSYTKKSARIIKEICNVLGEDYKTTNITLYSFRHSYCTRMYYNLVMPNRISVKKAAQICGHSEKIFLERYSHINDDCEKNNEIAELMVIS